MELALTLHIVTKMKIVHQLHFLQQLIRIHICYLFYYSKIFKYLIIVYLGSVFISSDATATTLVPFLQSIKKLVEKAAWQLVKGIYLLKNLLISLNAIIKGKLKLIIVWRIMNTSYSKRLEEFFNHHLAGVHIFLWSTKVKHQEKWSMKARYFQAFLFWHYLIIFIVFPDANIWICQFHVMQAILQWDKDHGDVFEPQPHLKLSLERKHSLLKAVHTLQHCWFVAW